MVQVIQLARGDTRPNCVGQHLNNLEVIETRALKKPVEELTEAYIFFVIWNIG